MPFQHLQQPNQWSCLTTAFAMALESTVPIMHKFLGHDGSEIWWPDNPEPYNRRGFHIQEIVHVAWLLGYNVTTFQARPVSGSAYCFKTHDVLIRPGLLVGALQSCDGVLVGEINGKHHAVAWHDGKVYDPNGYVYSIEGFGLREFFAVRK